MFKVKFSDGTAYSFSKPVTGEEVLKICSPKIAAPIVAWHVNHYLRPLNMIVEGDAEADWVDLTSSEGETVYQSTLCFLLVIAAKRVLKRDIRVNNSISEGLFWELIPQKSDALSEKMTEEDVELLRTEIDRMIAADLPIENEICAVDKACQYFIAKGRPGNAKLLSLVMSELPVELSSCDGEKDLFSTPLLPSTGYLKNYALSYLSPGVVLRFPTTEMPNSLPPYRSSKNLQKVFSKHSEWLRKLHVTNMVQVWESLARDGGRELILLSEALHAQQITQITEDFLAEPEHRVITIAGPSASGKTTTSHKLRIQLQVREKNPVALSLDDYFVDREKCPRDEEGNYDFEALDALNLDLLESQMHDLLAGKSVRLPKFDFYTGRSGWGRELKLHKEDVLIIEGLHGLNDKLINAIPQENRFGIFLAPLTSINLDEHVHTSTSDIRLMRRMVRDHRTRGTGPVDTLTRWPSVARGVTKYISPYQSNADAMFDSSLLYELPVMKIYTTILLRGIPEDSPVHGEAMRLLRLMRYVPIIDARMVPSNSLLREFIGGSIIEI